MNQVKAIIMDLDGVLMDSERATFHIWQTLMGREYGVNLKPEHYMNYAGEGSLMFEEAIHYHFPEVSVDRLIRTWREKFDAMARRNKIPVKTGFSEMIGMTKGKGLRRAIATSNTQTSWLGICREVLGFEENFDIVVTGNDVNRLKPYPDTYLLASQLLGVDPVQCIAIEDSAIGISAAVQAGMRVIRIRDVAPVSTKYNKLCLASFDSLRDAAKYLEKYL